MTDSFVLEIPEQVDLPVAAKRTAQTSSAAAAWPTGTRIVSADSHMLEHDIWIEKFPEHLKEWAPRIEFKDGGWQFWTKDRKMMPPEAAMACDRRWSATPASSPSNRACGTSTPRAWRRS